MHRVSVVFALLSVCALCARGQWFSFPRSQRFQKMPQFTVTAKAHAEPTKPVVGEPCAIILELDVDRKASLDQVRVSGLPEPENDSIVYGALENLADGKSVVAGHVVKRIRIPVRFNEPISREVSLSVEGMVGTVQGGSSFFREFPCIIKTRRIRAVQRDFCR